MDRTDGNVSGYTLELERIAKHAGLDVSELQFAQFMDKRDPLRSFRDHFHFPKNRDLFGVDLTLVDGSDDSLYLANGSQGLCPKKAQTYMDAEMNVWATCGVQGHLNGERPWIMLDEIVEPEMTRIVGGQKGEVAVANGLSVNLHLLMISFYRPTKDRYKILCEDNAFCSDFHAFRSETKLHGFKPEDAMIYLKPREGEFTLRTEDILDTIEREGDQIAVICFAGVQFYTGQLFDIRTITAAGQKKGCYVGWDLAHAAGNVPLYLHDWGVDFAFWCNYKYICCCPGSVASFFVHSKHEDNPRPRLQGWWSFTRESRILMDENMEMCRGAKAYRITNPPTFICAMLKASLEIFEKTSLQQMREKSILMTGYLEYLLNKYFKRPRDYMPREENNEIYIDIITSSDPKQRGAQLSLTSDAGIKKIFEELTKRGIVADVRSKIMRISPHPLYNRYTDVFRFIEYLKEVVTVIKGSSNYNASST